DAAVTDAAVTDAAVTDAAASDAAASDAAVIDAAVIDAAAMDGATADAGSDGRVDAPRDAGADAPSIPHPCDLPGAVQFTAAGPITVPGGSPSWPSLAFLRLPVGFCAHYYGTVGNARQLRFAPGGELFVASPTRLTTGGGLNGQAAILALPDDNLDGVADQSIAFLGSLPNTVGLLFANGHLYYQDQTKVMRLPYASGERSPSGPSEQVADIVYYSSALHWPKSMDIADDGSIYVGNGGDQGEACTVPHPFHGGIVQIDPAPNGPHPGGQPIVKGMRDPISVRCPRGHNRCFAIELAKDYTAGSGGREKLVPIHAGDDWGFPCCATANLPYADVSPTDCSGVNSESNSFLIGETPFDLDFERGPWPAPWTGRTFVVTHGAAGSWTGARLLAIPMDPSSGLLQPSTDTGGTDIGMLEFATGWDDQTLTHGRPAALAFAPDGRLFVANDYNGVIFWIAPLAP
ncbi:MAG TPA: hypothetical protein VGQ83_38435, partial [Polyangia bacterium]